MNAQAVIDIDDVQYIQYLTCPACDVEQDAEQALLGMLGNRVHCRCRYCGMQFNHLLVD